MSYKNILVYCNNAHLAARLFDVAVKVAKAHNAHLSGLFITPQPQLNVGIGEDFIADLMENQESFFSEQGKEIENAFDQARVGKKIKSHWSSVNSSNSFVSKALIQQSRYADLVILAQSNSDYDVAQEDGLPAEVILQSGRPVLMVPSEGDLSSFGENILVAWNSSRESSRAAFDALPFLEQAKKVEVFELCDEDDLGQNERLSGADLAKNLKFHGVKASDASDALNGYDVGAYFLHRARQKKFDMLVMGGYGHSRLAEFVLGGATRHVLVNAEIPVLLSH